MATETLEGVIRGLSADLARAKKAAADAAFLAERTQGDADRLQAELDATKAAAIHAGVPEDIAEELARSGEAS
jgi:hypothetical protein